MSSANQSHPLTGAAMLMATSYCQNQSPVIIGTDLIEAVRVFPQGRVLFMLVGRQSYSTGGGGGGGLDDEVKLLSTVGSSS